MMVVDFIMLLIRMNEDYERECDYMYFSLS